MRIQRAGDIGAPDRPRSALFALLGINIVVYILWQMLGRSEWGVGLMADHFLVSLEAMTGLRVWTLLTSAFSHLDFSHFLFNMIGLWVFGGAVEQVLGPRRFTHLYLAGGIAASLGHVMFSLVSGSPNPALGASGSVMALAVMFALLFPKRTLLINFFVPVPAGIAVAGYVLLDLAGAVSGGSSIAHAAHLGGALYGYLYYRFAIRPRLRRR